jgi:hypothetical protein
MRLLCISCRCEIERVDIARGRIVAICAACDAYGDAAELVAGVRLGPAEPLPPRLRLVQSLPQAKSPKSAEPQGSRLNRRAASGTR